MKYKTLVLTSPHMRGPHVRNAQWLLAGHNRYKEKFYKGKVDGIFGAETARAAKRAHFLLGFPKKQCPDEFGLVLRNYLIPKSDTKDGAKTLPKLYLLRRKRRLKAAAKKAAVKRRALLLALTQVGTKEYPPGSNDQKYGVWYGFNGVAWCAIFVSWCFSHVGRPMKTALAFQWEYWAHSGTYGLSITRHPEPGDIVVYHWGEGHTGIFHSWVNESTGHFQAVEGNTGSTGQSQDNGGEVLLQDRYTNFGSPTFVHVP